MNSLTTQQTGRALVFLPDMNTFAGQTAHYRSVKQRLGLEGRRKPAFVRRPAPMVEQAPATPAMPAVVERFVTTAEETPLSLHSNPGWRFLIRLVSVRTGISEEDIFGRSRVRTIVAARHEAIYMLALHTQYSLPQIALRLGLADHTTVMNALYKFPAIEGRCLARRERRRVRNREAKAA
jgi:hypothetical protein